MLEQTKHFNFGTLRIEGQKSVLHFLVVAQSFKPIKGQSEIFT